MMDFKQKLMLRRHCQVTVRVPHDNTRNAVSRTLTFSRKIGRGTLTDDKQQTDERRI